VVDSQFVSYKQAKSFNKQRPSILGKCLHAFHTVWHLAISWPAGALCHVQINGTVTRCTTRGCFSTPKVTNDGVQLCSYILPFFYTDDPPICIWQSWNIDGVCLKVADTRLVVGRVLVSLRLFWLEVENSKLGAVQGNFSKLTARGALNNHWIITPGDYIDLPLFMCVCGVGSLLFGTRTYYLCWSTWDVQHKWFCWQI